MAIMDEYGVFIGTTVFGTGLSYTTDGEGTQTLTGGTVTRIEAIAESSPTVGLGYFAMRSPDITDVAELNALTPDWVDAANFFTLYTAMGGTPIELVEGGEYVGTDLADVVFGQPDGSYLEGGAGDDVLRHGTYSFGGDGDDRIFGSNLMYGEAGNDTMRGSTGNDTMHGGTGRDRMFGRDGNDEMFGGAGRDRMSGGAGDDTMFGDRSTGLGDDHFDHLYGDAGNDRIYGSDGGAHVDGGTGNDTLNGGTGDDTILGGDGSDMLSAGFGGTDYMDGGDGTDYFLSRSDSAQMIGGNGSDHFGALGGDEWLDGGADNDILMVGNITIQTDAGFDTMTGGEGADAFMIDGRATSGAVVVLDFTLADDMIYILDETATEDLSISPTLDTPANEHQRFLDHAQQVGADVVWTNTDGTYSVTINNLNIGDLTDDNFTFTESLYDF